MENNNDVYWEEISKLKKIYYGKDDAYVEKHIDNQYRPKMKYYGTYALEQVNTTTYVFPKINLEKFVYKNLKLDGEIEFCQLEQNGTIIDKIDGVIFPTLRLLYGILDEKIVPFSFCKDAEFLLPSIWNTKLVICTGETHINPSIDIYEIIDDCEGLSDMIITQVQSTGKQNISRHHRLCFLHLTNYIIVHVSKWTLSRFLLQFNGQDVPIVMDDVTYYNGQYIIPLTKHLANDAVHGINFSNINGIHINFWPNDGYDFSDDDYLCVYGISYNGIKINSIKSELVFN
jgi:hypothetical protein